MLYFHSAVRGIKHEVLTEDSQSGELAHVREGRVGQGVDPIVAQISERKMNSKDGEVTALMCTPTQRRRSEKLLHQLQVFEARQFLRHNAELVSIQIPEQRHNVRMMRRRLNFQRVTRPNLHVRTNTKKVQYHLLGCVPVARMHLGPPQSVAAGV